MESHDTMKWITIVVVLLLCFKPIKNLNDKKNILRQKPGRKWQTKLIWWKNNLKKERKKIGFTLTNSTKRFWGSYEAAQTNLLLRWRQSEMVKYMILMRNLIREEKNTYMIENRTADHRTTAHRVLNHSPIASGRKTNTYLCSSAFVASCGALCCCYIKRVTLVVVISIK